MNYLVVDDDSIFADALARGLRRKGLNTSVANDVQSAIEKIRSSDIQRVILDLKIGQDSGLKLLPVIKQTAPDTEVVLLTGYSSIPTAVEAIKLGAIQYLCKPVDIDEILRAFNIEKIDRQEETSLREAPHSVDRLEWEHIQSVLMKNDGNISATARALGMHRRTLQRKLQKRPVNK